MNDQRTTSPRPSPLAEIHHLASARMGVWFNCVLPNDFGDWLAEYQYARQSVALLDKNYRAYLEFTGPDRVRYLNAILTNNIKDLGANHGVVSLFLNPQGHIQAEIETFALPERIFAISLAMIRERLIAGLDKYIIMDDVTLADRTDDFVTLGLEGPQAAAVTKALAGIDLSALEELELRDAKVGSIPARVTKRTPQAVPSTEFLVGVSDAGPLWSVLREAARQHGGGPAGYTALNALRLEQGIPWFGYDFGERQIPHEARLQDSHISYTKGCYTGQEIVERVRSRGQVNRTRILLKIDSQEPPAAGAPLLFEDKEVGYITRGGFSPAWNAALAMGYVRREKAEPGSELSLKDGGKATVIVAPVI